MNAAVENGLLIITGVDEEELDFVQNHLRMAWRSRARRWEKPLTPSLAKLMMDGGYCRNPEVAWYAAAHERAWHCDPPQGTGNLWQHQHTALGLITNLPGVLLAMEMATGKSRVIVEYAKAHPGERILIVCPKSVIPVWEMELEKWGYEGGVFPLKQTTMGSKVSGVPYVAPGAVIVNYESAWRKPLAEALAGWKPDMVVYDESQRLKSASSNVSKWARKLSRQVPKVVGLTGTPMPHGPLDIWAQMACIDPGLLDPSYTGFERRYAIKGGWENRQVLAYRGIETDLAPRLALSVYQARADDVLDLPETQHIVRPVELAPATMKVYRDLEEHYAAETGSGLLTAANAGVALLRLQQLTGGVVVPESGHPEQVDNGKADALADLLDGIGTGACVVFCRFRADLRRVREMAAERQLGCSELSGNENTLAEWQAGETQVLAVQIQAGGVGVDLSRAAVAIYYSIGWSLGDYLQSLARLRRPGQKAERIVYYHLVAAGTVDETVYRALEKKEDIVERVMKNWRQEP